MTENERMSISGLLDVLNTGISLSTCHMEYAIQSNVLEDLILCLEELEQYRTIGTPTQIYEKIGGLDVELGKYRVIGTIEDFKALKEKSVTKRIIQTVENGRMKRVFSCCGTDCTQMTSWMTPKFCPHCGSKTET